MGSKKSNAYIGRTRYKAGIFLSERIANRKQYANHLKLEKFDDCASAVVAFFDQYNDFVNEEDFRVNTLYAVRVHPGYDVFWSKYTIFIGEGHDPGDVWILFFKDDKVEMLQKHFDDYEEAQDFARSRFVSMWWDSELWIRHRIKIGIPVDIDEEFDYLLETPEGE